MSGPSKVYAFWTPGTAITKGSGHPMTSASGKPFVAQNNAKRLRIWCGRIREIAAEAGVREIYSDDVREAYKVDRAFFMRRPKDHYRDRKTGTGPLRDDAPRFPTTKKADIDKLTRSLLDALTSIAYKDDSQVVRGEESKDYCDEKNPNPGAWVGVQRL